VEQGDSFVAAFARASDMVKCALELQRASLAPIRLRIGLQPADKTVQQVCPQIERKHRWV
jgi:class 3 adenylate cyclase